MNKQLLKVSLIMNNLAECKIGYIEKEDREMLRAIERMLNNLNFEYTTELQKYHYILKIKE